MTFWDSDKTTKAKLKAGVYTAEVFNIENKESRTGEPGFSVQYKLNNNSRLWQNFTFRPTAAKWIRWQLGVLQVDTATISQKTNKSEDMTDLRNAYLEEASKKLGKYFSLEVSYKDHMGKEYQNVCLLEESDQEQFKNCKIQYEQVVTVEKQNIMDEVLFPVKPKDPNEASSIDEDEELPF